MTVVKIEASKRITATTAGAGVNIQALTGVALFVLNSSAPEGAAQTSDVKLQHSDTLTGTYTDTGVAFAQVTTASGASHQVQMRSIDGFKKFVRAVNTLGGASPAVTYGVQVFGKSAW
jgi:hypothetical protein